MAMLLELIIESNEQHFHQEELATENANTINYRWFCSISKNKPWQGKHAKMGACCPYAVTSAILHPFLRGQ